MTHDQNQPAPPARNPAVPDEKWRIYTLYESGKGRRYGLLFTVNGGAYALVGFLVGGKPTFEVTLLTVWAFVVIPAVLALFTLQMQKDIQAFGEYMRTLAAPHGLTLFGKVGQDVLTNICRLIVAAWCAAILAFLVSAWLQRGDAAPTLSGLPQENSSWQVSSASTSASTSPGVL